MVPMPSPKISGRLSVRAQVMIGMLYFQYELGNCHHNQTVNKLTTAMAAISQRRVPNMGQINSQAGIVKPATTSISLYSSSVEKMTGASKALNPPPSTPPSATHM